MGHLLRHDLSHVALENLILAARPARIVVAGHAQSVSDDMVHSLDSNPARSRQRPTQLSSIPKRTSVSVLAKSPGARRRPQIGSAPAWSRRLRWLPYPSYAAASITRQAAPDLLAGARAVGQELGFKPVTAVVDVGGIWWPSSTETRLRSSLGRSPSIRRGRAGPYWSPIRNVEGTPALC